MRTWSRAARFIIGSSLQRAGATRCHDAPLPVGDELLPAHVYAPADAGTRVRGTLLFVHGMTLRGHRDPRQVQACRALAGAGYRVVSPHLPAVARAEIDPTTVTRIRHAITAVADRPELCPDGQLGLFSASFSASMCLLATADPRIARHVSATCALGPYADLHACLRFVMEDPTADPYGRLVVFANLVERAIGERPAVRHALFTAIADDSLSREVPQLPQVREALSRADEAIVHAVLHDLDWCRETCARILDASPDLVEALDVLPVVDRLQTPVALVHGADDDVIPADHSRRLHDALGAAGVPSRLELTPLISHGDQTWGLRSATHALSLVDAFAWFFRQVEERGRVAA
ncbi:MAG: hypothetical protein H6742_12300 [Alphaproteobacteria bacterium]|nr:hypothetical protein [Alphaproteobacteria bacterium]